jgi:hypothetical protein
MVESLTKLIGCFGLVLMPNRRNFTPNTPIRHMELLQKLVNLPETCEDDQKSVNGLDREKSGVLDRSCVPSFTNTFTQMRYLPSIKQV